MSKGLTLLDRHTVETYEEEEVWRSVVVTATQPDFATDQEDEDRLATVYAMWDNWDHPPNDDDN